MSDVDFIKSMSVLSIKEGDVLVVKPAQKISAEVAKSMERQLQYVFREQSYCPRMMVLDVGMDIAVLRTDGPVLMSADNPGGWKLEELLTKLCSEIEGKIERISNDQRPVAQTIIENNREIISLLTVAEAKQRRSMAVLDALAPSQGPSGKPRIGVGSDGYDDGRATCADGGAETRG